MWLQLVTTFFLSNFSFIDYFSQKKNCQNFLENSEYNSYLQPYVQYIYLVNSSYHMEYQTLVLSAAQKNEAPSSQITFQILKIFVFAQTFLPTYPSDDQQEVRQNLKNLLKLQHKFALSIHHNAIKKLYRLLKKYFKISPKVVRSEDLPYKFLDFARIVQKHGNKEKIDQFQEILEIYHPKEGEGANVEICMKQVIEKLSRLLGVEALSFSDTHASRIKDFEEKKQIKHLELFIQFNQTFRVIYFVLSQGAETAQQEESEILPTLQALPPQTLQIKKMDLKIQKNFYENPQLLSPQILEENSHPQNLHKTLIPLDTQLNANFIPDIPEFESIIGPQISSMQKQFADQTAHKNALDENYWQQDQIGQYFDFVGASQPLVEIENFFIDKPSSQPEYQVENQRNLQTEEFVAKATKNSFDMSISS